MFKGEEKNVYKEYSLNYGEFEIVVKFKGVTKSKYYPHGIKYFFKASKDNKVVYSMSNGDGMAHEINETTRLDNKKPIGEMFDIFKKAVEKKIKEDEDG